jgi:hypothetical protein
VVKDILDFLGSSDNKSASEFLNRVAKYKWDKITLPRAAGVIARLRIIVLYIHRSPLRKQDWIGCNNVTKQIPYDVDTWWNYTLLMIEIALQCKAALSDLIDDHPELELLRLTPTHWKELEDIHIILTPFKKYTNQVSKKRPSIQLSTRMYLTLERTLQ